MDVQVKEKAFSLKREHPALQNMKFLKFFLLLWAIFALLDPDPDSGFRIRILIQIH
jgi:hypothetical protein